MASKKKGPAKRKSPAKGGKTAAKKVRSKKKKAPPKKATADPRSVYLTYDQYSGSLDVWPGDLKVNKRPTVITWIKYAGSDPITFELNPNPLQCPFGTLTLDRNHTKVTLRYDGDPHDKIWKYVAQVIATGVVEISSADPMTGGGSTIRNR